MKTKNYKFLFLAAIFAMVGLTGCQKDFPEFDFDKNSESITTYDQAANGAPVTYGFWAGQHINVGSLVISNDQDYIYVTFNTSGNWWLQLTHLHIANTIQGIPNRNGRPIPGHFDYKTVHNPRVQTYTYAVSNIWAEGDDLVIAAHAEVVLLDENGNVIQEETGFGGDTPGPGPRWWFYAQYTVQNPDDNGNGDGDDNGNGDGDDNGNGDGDDNGNGDGDDNGNGDITPTLCDLAWGLDTIGTGGLVSFFANDIYFKSVYAYCDEVGAPEGFMFPIELKDEEGNYEEIGHVTIFNPLESGNKSNELSLTNKRKASNAPTHWYIEVTVSEPYFLSQVGLYLVNSENEASNASFADFTIWELTTSPQTFRVYMSNSAFQNIDFDNTFYVAAFAQVCQEN